MKKSSQFFLFFVLILLTANSFGEELTWRASGNGGIVATGPKPSAQAGIDILKNGGNAVDAAVATVFTLAITDYGNFNIGGEVPFMFYSAKTGKVKVFNGMGGAPKDPKAIEWYYKNGIPKAGIRSSTVPSAVSTVMAALETEGTMTFEQVIAPTLALLDAGGKDWYAALAVTLRKMIDVEKSSNGSREQKIKKTRDYFYKGEIASELDNYYKSVDAFLNKSDLQAHKTVVEEPVSANYRGYTVYKCNTWTQGPVLLQSLKILENFDLKSKGYFSSDYIHIVAEAMKLAYADRDKYYGDPSFVKVPMKQLLSDEYAKIRYPLIDLNKASQEIRPGDPVKMIADIGPGEYWPGEKGTTTVAIVDKWGNAVAATPSANPEYGICEKLGIAHNTRLSSLNIQKGHPNCLEPGKRPRITLTPTIVLKNNKPVIVMSVAGGDLQDQTGLQLLLNVIDFGRLPEEAIPANRLSIAHIQDSFNPSGDPAKRILRIGSLDINQTEKQIVEELIKKGHNVKELKNSIALPVLVYIDQSSGMCYAAALQGVKYCAAINK